jgi:MYXO-CTERM domain-containing protein
MKLIIRTLSTVVVASSMMLLAPLAADAAGPPYSDPNAQGSIGLCNAAGQQITSGSIDTVPFAWRAVSTQKATSPYDNAYRTAQLLAYQPQEGLEAGEWSGEELTSSSRYTNPDHPMAAATDGDYSLKDFIEDFPLKWGDFIELRLYLDTSDAEVYSVTYPVLNIHVTGNTWHAVGGATVNCQSGTSESIETIVLPSTTTTTAPNTGSTTMTTSTSGATSTSTQPTTGATTIAHAASDSTPKSSSNYGIIAIVAALVAAALLATFLGRRRRSSPKSPPGNQPPTT